MADSQRDLLMRLVGRFDALGDAVERLDIPHELQHVRHLKETAGNALRKACLRTWEAADVQPVGKEAGT